MYLTYTSTYDIHKLLTFDKQMREICLKNVILGAKMSLFPIFFVLLHPIFNPL